MRLALVTALLAASLQFNSSAQCLVEWRSPSDALGARTGTSMDAALSPLTGDAIVAASSGFPTARAFVYRADGAALAPGWGDVEVLDTGVPGFTPVSVATNGSVVAVGAGRAAGTGQVFVFVDGPGGFVLADVLLPPAGSGALGFGSALAVSGRRIVVGAPGTDTAGLDRAGALFVYEQSGGGWRFTERI
ncbi:MAG: hypothetical protein AAFP86_01870, partial [Planctomycetota bacterium]